MAWLCFTLTACGGGGSTPVAIAAPGPVKPSVVKIKMGEGVTAFELKPKDDGAKVVDAEERELYRFKLKGDKLKIKDADDKVLGYVSTDGKQFKIKDASQQTVLFKLQQQADGDWKLEDGAQNLLAKIKKRDYGYTIRDANDNDRFKVKPKSGKTSLRDAADKTVRYTKNPVSALAFAALGLEALNDGQKLGLLFLLQSKGR